MAKYLDQNGLSHFMSKIKEYVDEAITGGAAVLGIDHGGTGATTAANALTNLGAASLSALNQVRDALSQYLPLSGGTVTGTLVLSKSSDAFGELDNNPALVVGGAKTAAHIEIDKNKVMAKSGVDTTAQIAINPDGGDVKIGKIADSIVNLCGTVQKNGTDLDTWYARRLHSHEDYLLLTGGTITGATNFKTTAYDRDAAVNTSGQNGVNVHWTDKDGGRSGTIRVDRDAGGIMRMKIGAFTENSSGTEVYNWLQFGVDRDGTRYYSVSDAPKFRTDLGITKAGIGLGNVENKSSATIRGELTSANVTDALGYTPFNSNSGTLALARGGTGQSLSAAPSIIVNLASTSGASPFTASPRPGVTGILPKARGGTGVSNIGDVGITNGSSTNVASGTTFHKIATIENCPAGTFIFIVGVYCAGNATGYRDFAFNTESNAANVTVGRTSSLCVNAGGAHPIYGHIVTAFEVAEGTDLYVWARQNSGSTLAMSAYIRRVRVG